MYKILKINLICILAIALSGCNKWLHVEPQDGIIKEKFWKTKEQVSGAVTGIYASLLGSPAGSRALTESLWLWGEARADMVTPTTQATSEEQEFVNVNILATNSLTSWANVYEVINYCNTVIELAPGAKNLDPTFTQEQLDVYLSQALAIRSLMYFYLVRTFRDVPLKLNATLTDEDIAAMVKSDADVVLRQIVDDLKKAEATAVTTYGNNAVDKGLVTKYTINAILADVYLWMNQYDNCITECDKLINSGQFGLLRNNGALFTSLYADGNSNESIFELQFDVQKTNPFFRMFLQSRRWSASFRVVDEFYGLDLNDPNRFDVRADGYSIRASDLTIWKYIGLTSSVARGADQSYAHFIVYRYADILLMKAEALNELGRSSEALEIVYRIRQRANALTATDLTPDPADKVAVGDFILAERSREFSFEGKRWFDILRFAKRQYTSRPDLLSNLILPSISPARQQAVIAKYRDPNSHYLPIYYYELQTNKLLVQNPFYK